MRVNKMQALINKLSNILIEKNTKLVTVESCTGGLVSQLVTQQAGSSEWFESGIVTYSNEAKQKLVGVEISLLDQYGAVSEQVALAMVEGAVELFENSVAISITGIAGPGGGSIEKPVGLVFIGATFGETSKVTRCIFDGSRDDVREQAAKFSLEQLHTLMDIN